MRFAVLQGQRGHERLLLQRRIAHLLIERVPVGDLAAVRQADHQQRQAGLAQKHVLHGGRVGLDIALRRHPPVALPEGVPVDEEIAVGGGVPAAQDVLELRGEHGQVVEHEVELEVEPQRAQAGEVRLRGQAAVQVIADDGKAPVEVAVEHAGQDVEGAEGALQLRPGEQVGRSAEGAAQAVRIGVEHRFAVHAFLLTAAPSGCGTARR